MSVPTWRKAVAQKAKQYLDQFKSRQITDDLAELVNHVHYILGVEQSKWVEREIEYALNYIANGKLVEEYEGDDIVAMPEGELKRWYSEFPGAKTFLEDAITSFGESKDELIDLQRAYLLAREMIMRAIEYWIWATEGFENQPV